MTEDIQRGIEVRLWRAEPSAVPPACGVLPSGTERGGGYCQVREACLQGVLGGQQSLPGGLQSRLVTQWNCVSQGSLSDHRTCELIL